MKISIGIHQTDRHLAEEIKNAIVEKSNTNIDFIQDDVQISVCKNLISTKDPVIVILSENFLKSANCMDGCLDLINSKESNLIPIVAPGTVLNKVTHIIRFINFWQDQYLELRKSKEDNEEYQVYLSTVRTISTEVGDFVRMLRNLELLDFEEIRKSNFSQILEYLNIDPGAPISSDSGEITDSSETTEISELSETTGISELSETTGISDSSEISETTEVTEKIETDDSILGADPSEEIHTTDEAHLEEDEIKPLLEQLTVDDENTDLLNKLAEEYIQKGEYENAKITLGKIKDLDPFYPNVHLQIAILEFHFLKQNYQLALEHIEKAILQNEKDSEPYYQKGLILNHLDAEEEKIRWQFEKAIELNPQHPFATYELAMSFLKSGDIKKANEFYLKSIEINPETESEENDKAFALPKEKPDSFVFTENLRKANEAHQGSNKKISEFISDLRDQIEQLQELLEKTNTQKPIDSFSDKTVLITGATSGIGKATAIRLAQEGFGKIIITGRRASKLDEIKKHIESQYVDCSIKTLCFDITNSQEVTSQIGQLLQSEPKIDILINNAGKAKGLASIEEGNWNHWEEMIDTNIKGLLYISKLVAKQMVDNQSGHILNIGSTAGKEVYPSGNVYCATKFAVEALTKAMRLDLYHHNIRVSQVSPGHVEETEFAKVRFDGDEERAKIYEDFIPLNARDVADTIAYILTRPAHVNIQDVLMMGTQQAGAFNINRSGR